MRPLQSAILKLSLAATSALALIVSFDFTVSRIPYMERTNENPLYTHPLTRPLVSFFHNVGYLSGLTIRWRMFSPADPINWRVRYMGVGSDRKLVSEAPLYWETSFESTSTLHHLLEFRERKAHLNSYYKHSQLGVIARQVCALRTPEYPNLAAVVVEYKHQDITPSQLDPRVPSLGEWKAWTPFETYLCP